MRVSSVFNGLQPWLRPYAAELLRLYPPARVTSVYRSAAEQARLYRRYLAGQHPYPVAPPGRSWHNYGRAWDMVAPDEILRRLGTIWQSWGGTWGGPADPIHFQA